MTGFRCFTFKTGTSWSRGHSTVQCELHQGHEGNHRRTYEGRSVSTLYWSDAEADAVAVDG